MGKSSDDTGDKQIRFLSHFPKKKIETKDL